MTLKGQSADVSTGSDLYKNTIYCLDKIKLKVKVNNSKPAFPWGAACSKDLALP